jgi:aminoglycoside 6'-N-acetyltransferase I
LLAVCCRFAEKLRSDVSGGAFVFAKLKSRYLSKRREIMDDLAIRLAESGDIAELAELRATLWPESSAQEHAAELQEIVAGRVPRILPMVVFVAIGGNRKIVGFLEVALRSHADGCDWTRPVGYVEGWFVSEKVRQRGIGAALLEAAENWARGQGCKEMASDTQIHNVTSQRVHEALGFEVAERAVLFRKAL